MDQTYPDRRAKWFTALVVLAITLGFAGQARAANLTEGFDVVPPAGWTVINNSTPVGTTSWGQGNSANFAAQAGAPTAYASANFHSTTGTNTISTWMITPVQANLGSGDTWSFWTRTLTGSGFPDRLEFRLSTNGSCSPGTGSASVGAFTTVLTSINPALAGSGYPETWTKFQGTLAGLPGSFSGCFAFRYFVTMGGPTGINSNYIGVDSFQYTDVTPPETSIDAGPVEGSTTSDPTPTFGFFSNEAGSTFACRVDTDAFAACSGPGATHTTAPLADGAHTFEVRATDPVGNLDASPASRAFTVHTAPPEVTITKGPEAKTTKKKATFEFSADEAATFACQLDTEPAAPCTSPTEIKAKRGKHTFTVTATDPSGKTGQASLSWKVKRKQKHHH
jgi:hypothetical protein